MYGGIVKLVVKPGKMEELLEFLRWDAEVARDDEPNTLRFDVWADPHDENVLYLYESYTDESGFKAHQAGDPYRKWVREIEPQMLANQVEIVPFTTCKVSNTVKHGRDNVPQQPPRAGC